MRFGYRIHDSGRLELVGVNDERFFEGSTEFLKGIRKQPPKAIVDNSGYIHRLARLSGGEESQVQLYLRL
uniref:Uncharacterized protein n=1 Tax=Candidatus Kentrum sp. LFY TaxID=2126342 RepID=A0A450U9I3_9GAMM|nr:MAG: hypothetical protein BECKLFY1418A_GA0070994_10058 [Candidatus Kentron sp. LFY]VFJ96999.1 MAG: hypothetical protein BECKLFY1418B_GA0070995_109310 [Candidatus Kentron sp. LFY]